MRLRNVTTGVVAVVSDEVAARLGADWVPADVSDAEPATKRTKK